MSAQNIVDNINHKDEYFVKVIQNDKLSTTNLPWLRICLLIETILLIAIYYFPIPFEKNLLFLYSLPLSWLLSLLFNQIKFFKKLATTKNEQRASMLLHSQSELRDIFEHKKKAILIVQNNLTNRYMSFCNSLALEDNRTKSFLKTLNNNGCIKALDDLNDQIKSQDSLVESSPSEAVQTYNQISETKEEIPSPKEEEKKSEE